MFPIGRQDQQRDTHRGFSDQSALARIAYMIAATHSKMGWLRQS